MSPVRFEVLETAPPWETAARTPIVLQHGLGLSRRIWRPWLRRLPDGHPVVTIDLRGHGDSAAPWEEGDESIEGFGHDVLAVLDHLGIEAFHFVGESVGGTIGLHLAGRHPERVRSLTMCSAGYRGERIGNVDHWPALALEEGIAAWSEQILAGRFAPGAVPDELIAWTRAMQVALAPEVVGGIVRALRAVDLEPVARELRTPLLVLAPTGSPFVDVSAQVDLARTVEGAEIAFMRGAQHGIVLSHWRECSAAAGLFIARVDAAQIECRRAT